MVRTTLYVEGGGDTREQKIRLRKGLRRFLERAPLEKPMPGIVACGSRDKAYDKFKLGHSDPNRTALLLVDSEGPAKSDSPWRHLKDRDNWALPKGTEDYQCHLMVQFMESWFLADREELARFFGHGFSMNSLPQSPRIEHIPKQDVENGLKNATKGTRKRRYNKGSHSFAILAKIDPEKVMAASPYARRLVTTLKKLSSW